ncbi:MAG: Hsp20/alpha crystallin family protein [Bacteriovorax sp.]
MNFLKSTSSRNHPTKSRSSLDYGLRKNVNDFINRRGEDHYDKTLSSFSPEVYIEETDDAYLVEAEIPGVKKEDVEVFVKNDYLVIKGENRLHRVERSHNGSFYRTIALPSDIDKDQIDAELKDGLLQVEIKKSTDKESTEKKIMVH